jgi:hypothetical protein
MLNGIVNRSKIEGAEAGILAAMSTPPVTRFCLYDGQPVPRHLRSQYERMRVYLGRSTERIPCAISTAAKTGPTDHISVYM